MVFSDDRFSVGENLDEVSNRLDEWRLALKRKGLRLVEIK